MIWHDGTSKSWVLPKAFQQNSIKWPNGRKASIPIWENGRNLGTVFAPPFFTSSELFQQVDTMSSMVSHVLNLLGNSKTGMIHTGSSQKKMIKEIHGSITMFRTKIWP